MSKLKKKSQARKQSTPPAAPPHGWKLWRLRLMAMVGVPLLFVLLLEEGLRLGGFGYPTAFLLRSSDNGRKTFVQNNQFGWRFFGARMARLPRPFSIERVKPKDTVRIFVFGESAAFGDLQPRFGLPRMLEAMLALRHPGTKFEVINAAMTGINSHVIVPIARDCARAKGDIWVIYMGNNEVVGPFGAGTIFGNKAAPVPVIRASLALKSTRIGELLDSLRQDLQKTQSEAEWSGMRMFLKNKVRADDARMEAVYRNFQRNLADIIHAGHYSGASVVVSTVGVNLRDCAPFASLHRATISEAELAKFDELFKRGVVAQENGKFADARSIYRDAAQIDDSFADLRFRMGQCALALGDNSDARKELVAARDFDALRFRCDSRLNDLIRQSTANRESERILLADGEAALTTTSADTLPGAESFYEHVHLTFHGNFILARAIAEQVEKLLPKDITTPNRPWPEITDCARRLAHTDRDEQIAFTDMLGRLTDAPFTFQSNHAEQQRRMIAKARQLPPANSGEALRNAQKACQTALTEAPDDPVLHGQLADVKQAQSDYAGAVAEARHALDLLPSDQDGWLRYGLALAQEEKFADAADAFRRVFALDPEAVWARHNLALCLEKMGHRDEAIAQFKRALAIKPQFGTALLGLGQLYEEMGRTNEANQCYQSALTNRVNRADDLAMLARFCVSRHWFEAASTNFADAIELNPSDPGLLMEFGRTLAALGRHNEAAQRYAQAEQLEPDEPQAHLQLGVELGRLENAARAEQEFREALRLSPNSTEARLNLGIALFKQNKYEDALRQFDEVLQQRPNDALAMKYVQLLQAKH